MVGSLGNGVDDAQGNMAVESDANMAAARRMGVTKQTTPKASPPNDAVTHSAASEVQDSSNLRKGQAGIVEWAHRFTRFCQHEPGVAETLRPFVKSRKSPKGFAAIAFK